MSHHNPFQNLESLGDDSNTTYTGNNSSSKASSKKKRGLAREFQVRMHLLIIYERFKDAPNYCIALVVNGLEECYDISHVAWFDLKEKIKDAWKRYIYVSFNTTLIVGNNLGDVKASPALEFVLREDWVKFVDCCNSEKFLVYVNVIRTYPSAKIKRNKENRAKLIASCTLGRTSMPINRHKLARHTYAEEKGITDEEMGRVEVHIPAHTKKYKTIQCPDVIIKTFEGGTAKYNTERP
ncbi:hypothetical protein GIB67_020808 [Kingdonia uniflora]|uniref:Uncharacterized protein n=1 Tax=Kingdonia uniflora TaxID=39325 RepID=A0A7J7M770_9MAGN|nr:hypothetical protein GIB67_020808 [Kingdonia uniflora]